MSYALGIPALEVRTRAVEMADPAVREMAADFVNQGNTAFRAGDYDTAIRRYTDAWTLYPAQNVLLLIGVTMMRQGRFVEAGYRFERYLRESPNGDQRALAQEQLANARAARERQTGQRTDMDFVAEGAAPATPTPTQTTYPMVPASVLAEARRAIQTPVQAQQAAPPPTSIANPYRERSYGPLIAVTVVGLGAIGLAAWFASRRKAPAPVTANRRRRRRR